MSSSSSSKPKHDQKLKSVVVAVEEKETMNNPQKSNKIYICYSCRSVFPTPHALGCHHNTTHKDRELEQHKITTESRLSGEGFLMNQSNKDKSNFLFGGSSQEVCPLRVTNMNMSVITHATPYRSFMENTSYSSPSSHQGISFGPFQYGGGGKPFSNSAAAKGLMEMKTTMFSPSPPDHVLTKNTSYITSSRDPLPSNNYSSNDIDLDLTLGLSKSTGGSNNNNTIDSSFSENVTRGTTNVVTPVRPHVSRFRFLAGNPLDSVVGHTPPGNTSLCHDLFSLQENGSSSSQAKGLIIFGKNMVPPLASPYQENGSSSSQAKGLIIFGKNMVPHLASPYQENGSSSSHSKSLISKGKNKVMVPNDDDKDIGMIRWLSKKKRSRVE